MDATALPEIVEVTDGAALEALRPAWEALWRRTPGATPFQSPAWLIPWWRVFGRGELLALAVHENGRLAGLAPFYLVGSQGRRRLLPVGIGITDRLDPLLEPRHGRMVLDHLARRRQRIDLEDLDPASPLLATPAPSGWQDERHACLPRPVLDLAQAVSRLAKLPYYHRRAERLGEVRLALAGRANLDEALTTLFALHGARWAERGELGVLADPDVQRFHRVAAPELLAAGLLRCHVLRLDGRIAAVLHALVDRERLHAYLLGYDPALPHPGLGALMIGHTIVAARAEGLRSFDFLRGGEAYKYAWGAVDEPAAGRRLSPPS